MGQQCAKIRPIPKKGIKNFINSHPSKNKEVTDNRIVDIIGFLIPNLNMHTYAIEQMNKDERNQQKKGNLSIENNWGGVEIDSKTNTITPHAILGIISRLNCLVIIWAVGSFNFFENKYPLIIINKGMWKE